MKTVSNETVQAAPDGAGPGKPPSANKKRSAAKAGVEASVPGTLSRETAVEPLIAVRAYELWESQGRPHGHDETNWQQAEREVLESLRNGALTANTSARKPAARSRR